MSQYMEPAIGIVILLWFTISPFIIKKKEKVHYLVAFATAFGYVGMAVIFISICIFITMAILNKL